jgi:hypothetical protein
MKRVSAALFWLLLTSACGDDPGGPALTPTIITRIQAPPDDCTLGVPTELSAIVTDVNGTPVPGVVVTFAVETGTGTVSPSTSTTDDNGIAATVFTCALPIPGSSRVVASFDGVVQNNAMWGFAARAGTLATIDFRGFARPDSIPLAAGFTPPLGLAGLLRDAFGGSPPATVTWEIVNGGGSLSQHSTEAFDCSSPAGYGRLFRGWCVSNTLTLGTIEPGVHAIRVSSPDYPDFEQRHHVRVVPGPFTIIPEPSAELSGEAGSILPTPLAVRVLDGNGSPIPRVVVHFRVWGELAAITSADTGLDARHVYTDLDGRAAVRYTLPTNAGSRTNVADLYMLAADGVGPSIHWSLSVLPGPPAVLKLGTGNDQSGSVGQPLGGPLGVWVEDQFGNIVHGQSVAWAVTSGGGSLAQSTTVSSELAGHENIWTLGPTPGVQTATASFGGMTVTFTAFASSGS